MVDELWSDAELRIAVETYLFILRLEQAGLRLSDKQVTSLLMANALQHRNEASIRYRFRNISSVIEGLGWRRLAAYSPAHQVGARVRLRLEEILKSHPMAPTIPRLRGFSERPRAPSAASFDDLRSEIRLILDVLDDALAKFEAAVPAAMGHNRPPEPIDELALPREIEELRSEVRGLRQEISKAHFSRPAFEKKRGRFLELGIRFAAWVGERITKAADKVIATAIVTVVPVFVLRGLEVLPPLAEVVGGIEKVLQRIPFLS